MFDEDFLKSITSSKEDIHNSEVDNLYKEEIPNINIKDDQDDVENDSDIFGSTGTEIESIKKLFIKTSHEFQFMSKFFASSKMQYAVKIANTSIPCCSIDGYSGIFNISKNCDKSEYFAWIIVHTFISYSIGHYNESLYERFDHFERKELVGGKTKLAVVLDLITGSLFNKILTAKPDSYLTKNVKIPDNFNKILKDYEYYLEHNLKPEIDIFHITGAFVDACSDINYDDHIVRPHPYSPSIDFWKSYTFGSSPKKLYGGERGRSSLGGYSESLSTEIDIFNINEIIMDILDFIVKNNASSKLCENLIGSIKFAINRVSVDYHAELSEKIGSLFKNDFSLSRPNSRYLYSGLIYPSLIDRNVNIILAFDYSGSIKKFELDSEMGAIQSILQNYKNYKAIIMPFHTVVIKTIEIEYPDTVEDKLPEIGKNIGGQGGTVFQCVFDEIEGRDDCRDIDLIVLVSADGEGGNINLNNLRDKGFKGKVLYLFQDIMSSQQNAKYYDKQDSEILFYPVTIKKESAEMENEKVD